MEAMEKISVSDLSVGDWLQARMVKWDYEDLDITPPMRVAEISSDEVMLQLGSVKHYAFVEDLQPIPITAEVLEKNGWLPPREEIERDSWWWSNKKDLALELNEYGDDWYLQIISKNEEGWQYNKRLGIGLKHIHQLQRALRLAKVDKEIEL